MWRYRYRTGTVAGVQFDPATGLPPAPVTPVPAATSHAGFVTALAWLDLPTRLLVTAGADGLIRIWR